MAEIPSAGVSRRALLAAGTSLALAGCLGDGDDSNETTDEPTTDGTDDIHRPNGTGDGPDNETDAPSGTDDPEPQPRGRVRSLTVTGKSFPTTVRPNRGLITAAVLTNTGDGEGDVTVTATLRGDDGVVAKETTTRTLAAGSDATVPLTGTPDALLGQTIASTGPGTYELVATSDGDGRTARLTVQTPATPALSALDFGETPITTDRTELSPTVTLANEGDIAGVFDLTLRLERTDDSSVRREATASQQVTPGDEARLTVPVDVSGLAPGTYRVTVTAVPEDAPARETSVTGELSVEQAPGALDITVCTQAANEEYEARAGTLRVREQGADEPLLTHDLSDSPSVTVNRVATGDELLLTTENIDDGVYPDGEQTVTVEGTTEVEFVTAYEFQGADSFRLAAYLFAPNPSPPDVIDPSANYYVWATHAADDDHYIRWYRVAGGATHDFDDSTHNHGVDLRQFQQSGRFAPVEQVRIGGEAYGHRYRSGALADEQSWNRLENDSPAYDPENLGRENFGPIYPHRPLTRLTGATPEKQQFAGPVEINGQTFHQYDIAVKNYPDSRAFVEPETAYVMRFETEKTYAGPSEQGYEIWTYSDHGTINSLSLLELDFGGAEPPL